MRLASFEVSGRSCVGAVLGTEVTDLQVDEGLESLLPLSLPDVERRLARAAPSQSHALADVRLRAPILRPDKILGIGANFTDFVDEARAAGLQLPPDPIWFDRPRRCVCGPDDEVWIPDGCDDLDYEGELVVVIGRSCRGVSRDRAAEVIGGYTIGNDITMRRRAMRAPLLGKSFDTHAPIGPVLLTPDELGDPQDVRIRTYVNGELRQNGTTRDMILDCYAQIATLSEVMTLSPGDLIFSGTPAGCGLSRTPPRPLFAGDIVSVEIDGIGRLTNTIANAPLSSTDRL